MKTKPLRKDTLVTRARLIDAAEQLFADQGIEGTSLLDVAKVADQKNRSALQYHFNNKEGLINAVLDRHASGIVARSEEMLHQLETKADYTLYDVVEAVITPLSALLDSGHSGRNFLKIHRELMFSDRYSAFRKTRSSLVLEAERLFSLAERFFVDINPDDLSARVVLVDCLIINGLVACMSEDIKITRPIFLHTLIQGVVDILIQSSPSRT